jgi:hypothetical protein
MRTVRGRNLAGEQVATMRAVLKRAWMTPETSFSPGAFWHEFDPFDVLAACTQAYRRGYLPERFCGIVKEERRHEPPEFPCGSIPGA